jgi:hypothetical protein
MTTEGRIQAVERFGFSRRRAGFLVTVMSHSGVCLPRQYATFAGIAYGHKVNRFFERLVGRGFASACPCLHNRALVYHVHSRALYRAIGEPHSRRRRPVPAAAVAPRLMLLDAVLQTPELTWLAGEQDKVEHFTTHAGIPLDCLPQQAARTGGAVSYRPFPDALPIGVEPPNRTLFVHPATTSSLADFRPFLRRHLAFLTALPAWTLRLVFAPDQRPVEAAWQATVDREIGPLLAGPGHAEHRVEWWTLGRRYGHLSPLVTDCSGARRGVEQGEQVGERLAARSQPPWSRSPGVPRRALGRSRIPGLRTNNYWPCVM